jgi:hypothetical protein
MHNMQGQSAAMRIVSSNMSAMGSPPLLPRLASPSWLVAVAAYGEGKRTERRALVHSVGSMCRLGQQAALFVDAAAVTVGWWERLLAVEGCDEGLPCTRTGCVQHTHVRYHPETVGTLLTAQHMALFRANLDNFDWFLYSEDDIGWTPWSVMAWVAEFERLRHADFTPNDSKLHAVPGFIRWEARAAFNELNVVDPNRLLPRALSSGVNQQPLDRLIGNDLFFRLCVLPRIEAHDLSDRSSRYLEMCNPHQAMWILPQKLLRAKLARLRWHVSEAEPPQLPPHARPQEWWGGGWLFRCPRQRKLYQYCVPSQGMRKLVPCERVCDFLVQHFGGKYSYGNGSEWMDLGVDGSATLATALGNACGRHLDRRCM